MLVIPFIETLNTKFSIVTSKWNTWKFYIENTTHQIDLYFKKQHDCWLCNHRNSPDFWYPCCLPLWLSPTSQTVLINATTLLPSQNCFPHWQRSSLNISIDRLLQREVRNLYHKGIQKKRTHFLVPMPFPLQPASSPHQNHLHSWHSAR